MISEISEKITKMSLQDEQEKFDQEVVKYGLELLLSTVFNLLIVIGISIVLHCFIETIIFFIIFSSLRFFAGGYHASSHLKCLLFYGMICFGTIYFLKFFSQFGGKLLWVICLSIIGTLLVFRFAPSEAKQKPLSAKEITRYKKISRLLVVTESIGIIFLCIVLKSATDDLLIATGAIFSEALTLVSLKNGGKKNDGNESIEET